MEDDLLSSIQQNIEMQLAEVELLQSMYPGEHEFKLNDVTMLDDLRQWLECDSSIGEFSYLCNIKLLKQNLDTLNFSKNNFMNVKDNFF